MDEGKETYIYTHTHERRQEKIFFELQRNIWKVQTGIMRRKSTEARTLLTWNDLVRIENIIIWWHYQAGALEI